MTEMKSSSTTYLDFDGVLSSSQEDPLTTGVESSMNVVELVLKQCSKSHEKWALHYVDKGLVSMIMAQPSNRCCYQVRPIEDQKQSGKSTSRESKTPCLCLNNRYCTCPDFETNVITKRNSQICKHLLAVLISQVFPDKISKSVVSDQDFMKILQRLDV